MTPLPPTFTEETKREFEERFLAPAQKSYQSAVADQVAPYRHQVDNMIEAQDFLLSRTQAAYDLGRAETLKEVRENLPAERIVHGYMKTQDEGKSTDYCNGWNDFRNAAITRLTQ